ncbi:MAG: DUF512 domain-containing protein [Armatimonadetes bacterium]|nr:DUF512 domain-containing protein [Armatimonadota bacterium]
MKENPNPLPLLKGRARAVVASVEPGSIAEEIGIEPGDVIRSVNGKALQDMMEYRYQVTEPVVELMVQKAGAGEDVLEACEIEKDPEEDLGITFRQDLFDRVRECTNKCVFCFIDQLPKGVRGPLWARDDDYRLSFQHGNFITLTNLSRADSERIVTMRLSPLYISIHATDPVLRSRLLGVSRSADILSKMRYFAEHGIEMFGQVVCCPGLNDGEALRQTIFESAQLYPHLKTVGIVPVGLTRHREGLPELRLFSPEESVEIIRTVSGWQRRLKKEIGSRFAYLADEFYLRAGLPFPSSGYYQDYGMLEDGIGMSRLFLDQSRRLAKRLPARVSRPTRLLLITGRIAVPVLEEFTAALNRVENLSAELLPVPNRFFGEDVTVTGLLVGQDIRDGLQKRLSETAHGEGKTLAALPSVTLRAGVFLDDMTFRRLQESLPCEIRAIEPTARALHRLVASDLSYPGLTFPEIAPDLDEVEVYAPYYNH